MKSITHTVLGLALAVGTNAHAAKLSKEDYVAEWKDVAVEQMSRYNIPASITMAQAILESGSGNSKLAVKGNNHFGIKCHGWKGKKMYMDDDRDDECFRVYKSAEQSYEDHSIFLTSYKRYAFLFDFDVTDYKSWAHGLKKAGYATNPKYPKLLIEIIEDLELYELDESIGAGNGQDLLLEKETSKKKKRKAERKQRRKKRLTRNTRVASIHDRGVKYVVAQQGDTYYRISSEFGLTLSQLYRYNDFEDGKEVLEPGDMVYVQPKKKRSLFKNEELVVNETISLDELAQKEATSERTIRKLNNYSEDIKEIAKGEKVTLR